MTSHLSGDEIIKLKILKEFKPFGQKWTDWRGILSSTGGNSCVDGVGEMWDRPCAQTSHANSPANPQEKYNIIKPY